MALTNCPECGRKVSAQAAKCPGCGAVVNKMMYKSGSEFVKPGGMAAILCGAVAAAAVIVVVVLKLTGVIG